MATDSYTFTVGKLDAGMAILLGERAHLIEFPSILLPAGATTGSIVSIAVHQNHAEEKRRDTEFWDLQQQIVDDFGHKTPSPPQLNLRNVTQTSVTLEWPPIELATAKLRSLDMYRDGQRLAAIPSPVTNTSTKLSGLKVEQEYTFQLVLRTTAGTYPSNLIRVRTHAISDTSGISVCFGNVQDEVLLENAKMALQEMKAKWSDKIQIDTTHFVCTTPSTTPEASGASAPTAPGVEYQRALQLSIPIVQPHWILACHSERTMVPIANFYLGNTPPTPSSAGIRMQPTTAPTPPASASINTPGQTQPEPSASRSPPPEVPPVSASSFVNSQSPAPEEAENDDDNITVEPVTPTSRKRRSGTMDRNFKFPSPTADSPPPLPSMERKATPTPEVPPPPPVEKERSNSGSGGGTAGGEEGEEAEVSTEGMTEIEL